MKRLFAIIIALFSISTVNCTTIQSEISIEEIVTELGKIYDTSFCLEEGLFSNETFSTNINDYQINIFEKIYSDKVMDNDDWYNAKDMEYLYNQIKNDKLFTYNFGNKISTSVINNVYVTNYFVFAIGDNQDIRFERFIILFFPDRAIIFQFVDNNVDKYFEELTLLNYLVKTDDYFAWNYTDNSISKLIDDLIHGRLNNTNIGNYYNFSEKLLEKIMSFLE